MPAWLIWLILAGAFAGGETVSGSFILLMMSGGAASAAITATFAPAIVQVIVGVLMTLALLWGVRPIAIRHLHPDPALVTGSDALVGRDAVVLSAVSRDTGLVRLNGGQWTARAIDPAQDLPAGTRVTVVAIDGATAVVWQDPLRASD